jgi:restriction endonuclease S subunit
MVLLKDIAEITSGLLFRSAIKPVSNGGHSVIQIKDTSNNIIDWAKLSKVNISGRVREDLVLRDGDILFRSRGDRNTAVIIKDCPANCVAASQLFIIRLKESSLLPDYLAWYINQKPAQRYFGQNARGSYIRLINKQVLGLLKVSVLPLQTQGKIIKVHQLSLKEKQLVTKIQEKREQLIDTVMLKKIQNQ